MNNHIGPNINAYNAQGNKPLGKQETKEDKLTDAGTKASSKAKGKGSGHMPQAMVDATKANLGLGNNIESLVPNDLAGALGLPSKVNTHVAAQMAVDNAAANVELLSAGTIHGLQQGLFA